MSESLLFRLVSSFVHTSNNKVGKVTQHRSTALLIAAFLFCGISFAGPVSIFGQIRDGASVFKKVDRTEGPAIIPIQVTAPLTVGSGISPGQAVVPISVSDITGEGIISFNFLIVYDPAVIHPSGPNFGCSVAGTIAGNAGAGVLCNVIPDGTLRVLVSGVAGMSGAGTIVNITFAADPLAVVGNTSALTFSNVAFYNGGGPVANVPNNGLYTIFPSTSAPASVGGRVMTSTGRPISNAQVFLTDNAGLTRTVVSNPFGFFQFDDVGTGSTYILGATSKRYTISPRLVSVQDNIASADLIAEP